MRKLNRHNLLKNLNSLCKFLSETYYVNSGGCCYLASLIAKHLDRLGIKYDLVIYDSCARNQIHIEHEVSNCHKNKGLSNSVVGCYSCDHYCINLRGAGIINDDKDSWEYQYYIPNISYKNIKWIYRNGIWNNRYGVEHNKTIKNIIKEFFKEYEKIPTS